MSWVEIFNTVIDNRDVKGWRYDGEDYRVDTTIKTSVGPKISGDQGQMVVMPAFSAGDPCQIDGATPEELRKNLVDDGEFTSDQAAEIIGLF